MNFTKYILLFIVFTKYSFAQKEKQVKIATNKDINITKVQINSKIDIAKKIFSKKKSFYAGKFDFPVGKPNAKGYYNAQRFKVNNHLGDDWNAVTGGNTDLGDPIYSIANGYINFAQDIGGGWGKVIRIWHLLADGSIIESLYAHCDKILIKEGEFILRGQNIATIGNADGQYLAHLHLEIRNDIELPIGGGYSFNTDGYLDPTKYINDNRK